MERTKESPHLPSNYVTLKQLQERRLKEEEDRLRKLKEAEEEETRRKEAAAAAAAKERRRNQTPPRPAVGPEKPRGSWRAPGSKKTYRVKQQSAAPVSNPVAGNQEGEKDAGNERKPRGSKKPNYHRRKQPQPPNSNLAGAGDRKPEVNDSSDKTKVASLEVNGVDKEADRVEPKKKNYRKKKRVGRKLASEIYTNLEEIASPAKEEVKKLTEEVLAKSSLVSVVTSRSQAGRESEVVEKIGDSKIVGSNAINGEANGGKAARRPSEINANVEEIAPLVKEEVKNLMEEVSVKSPPVSVVTSRGEAGQESEVVEKIGDLKIVGSNVMKGEANGGKAARERRQAHGRRGRKNTSFWGRSGAAAGAGMVWVKKTPDS